MSNATHTHATSVDGLLTAHEARTLLDKGSEDYRERVSKASEEHDSIVVEIGGYDATLDAALDDKGLVGGTQTQNSPAQTGKAYARLSWLAMLDLVSGRFAIIVGVLMLMIGGLGIPAIDAAMFYELFSNEFEDVFGDMSTSDSWLAILFSGQALGTFLAAKLFLSTPERRSKLALFVFIGGMLFASGAALERAEQKIADSIEYSETDVGFAWEEATEAPAAEQQPENLHLSAYLLSTGFIVLPLLGALLLSTGWETYTVARLKMASAMEVRSAFRKRTLAMTRKPALERQIKALLAAQVSIERKPLEDRIAEIIAKERTIKEAAKKARTSGLDGVVTQPHPHDPSEGLNDVKSAEADADMIISTFGNGFSDARFEEWRSRKPPD